MKTYCRLCYFKIESLSHMNILQLTSITKTVQKLIVIILIIQYLYSAMESEDTEALKV